MQQNFVEYVERFVNVSWEKKALPSGHGLPHQPLLYIGLKRKDMVGKRVKEPKPDNRCGETYIDEVEDYTPTSKDKHVSQLLRQDGFLASPRFSFIPTDII